MCQKNENLTFQKIQVAPFHLKNKLVNEKIDIQYLC